MIGIKLFGENLVFETKEKKFKRPFIIAEIGNNHEGSFEIAKKLIFKAKQCGVDAVKFQTFKPELYINNTDKKRFKQLTKYQLTFEEFTKLSKIAKKNKLKFISTPFDVESANHLNKIVDYFKISSGDNNYYELISEVLSFKKKTIISTGLLNIKELNNLYKFIKKKSVLKNISLLHCVASYPADFKNINLARIKYIERNFKVVPGFSDHTMGLTASIAAYFFGAQIIEKHFTLDNNFSKFRDHRISLNPNDMTKLVNYFKELNMIKKTLDTDIYADERLNLPKMRRSYYANKFIKKGEILDKSKIKFVRPALGKSINKLKIILNKTAKRNILNGELLTSKIIK